MARVERSTRRSVERSYIGPPLYAAKVADAMRVGVITCSRETSLADVAKMMVGYDVHSVVVSEAGDDRGAWGIVTSLDLARAADELDSLTAGDVASTELITIASNQPLEAAAELMAEHRVTHLVVLQPDTPQPVGVISARGVAAAVAYGGSGAEG
jgi:CBS domain-containing protein